MNPAARHDKSSPIFGMPIIDADKAKACIAIKRSMNPGFAGIDNELYYADNTLMVFGDAKGVLGDVVARSRERGDRLTKAVSTSNYQPPTPKSRPTLTNYLCFGSLELGVLGVGSW